MFESTEIRITAPIATHDELIGKVQHLIGRIDDCESVNDELIICQDHQDCWMNVIPLSSIRPTHPIKITLFDQDTNATFVLNLLGGRVVVPKTNTEQSMQYGAFLMFNLLCGTILYGEMVSEAPHDEQFSLSLALYQDFLDSTFNADDKSEYECIVDYLHRVDVIHIIDQHIK